MIYTKKLYNWFNKIANRLEADNVSAYASQAAFFLFISAFPFLLLLLTIIRFSPLTKDMLLSFISGITTGVIQDTLTSWVNELYDSHIGFMSFSIVIVLWSASKGILGIVNNINKIYGFSDHKKDMYVIKRLLSILYTFVLIAIIIAAFILINVGNYIGAWLEKYIHLFLDYNFIIALAMFFFIFLIIYTYVPYKKVKLKEQLPGVILTTCGCLVFSFAYSIYMDYIDPTTSIYGSLSAIIFLLLWLYSCMYILFCGASLNVYFMQKKASKKPRTPYNNV
ncbi:MAG: YihY/virulence factor BrkB family protein [Lachnospiraceae bacterium]|nr:YihY/virulence factor BrkB family protein [Lachnospiraceae bacterium]